MPTILVNDNPLSAAEVMRELAPSGFNVVLARPNSPEWTQALGRPNTSWAWAK